MLFKPSKHDRATFGKIASEYNLTYYGTIMPTESSDYTPVRGMTASPEQIDDNYTSGVVAGYGVQLLQRSHDIYTLGKRKANRTWTIVQVDLINAKSPHLIIGSNSKTSGDDLTLAAYLRMYEIAMASLDTAIADDFASKFAVYVSPRNIQTIAPLFTPEFQAMLSVHFASYDFEINDDKLYVYTTKLPLTLTDLDKQLRVAIWLAKLVDEVL